MRKILRHFVLSTVSLYLVSNITKGLVFEKGIETLLLTGIALTIASLFARPIINILLLPLNLITFGLFRWVASAVTMYIVTLLVPSFKILYFNFLGYSFYGVNIPALNFSGIVAFVAFSFLISLTYSLIHWLVK
ncbi:phage holin family protein [Candidatus Woesebacteria bacterium]|nr:phage holin family protein [Candidatus Woesebacteria bacterium]